MPRSTEGIIDFHAHLDDSPERLAQLFAIQARAGIASTVVVSGNLLNPAWLGDYLRGTHSLDSYEPNNSHLLRMHEAHPDRLFAFFTIDPFFHMASDIIEAHESGFKGFKLNPIVHKVDLRDNALQDIYAFLDDHKLPLYLHITQNPAASLESVAEISQTFRAIRFVIGHMGYATCDQGAIQLTAARPNVYLETSVGSMLALISARQRGISKKLIYGSEFPGHDPEIELSKLRLIFTEVELLRICRLNALQLMGADDA